MRQDVVLSVNSGSSSVKCALFSFEANPSLIARDVIDGAGPGRLPDLLAWVQNRTAGYSLHAVGHRIVHGGPTHTQPERVTPGTIDHLRGLIPFAPNHLPDEIALIEAFQRTHAGVPQIACFDTAFHSSLPDVARRLAIPAEYDAQGVRRYGFHGLSYSYLLEELRRIGNPGEADARVILAHLGNGSSLAAVLHGRSVDTTMGFTPIGGVVMSTRSGDLDPGVVTYLGRTAHLSADDLETLLSQGSGLAGISETTGDVRALLARERDDPRARLALEIYAYGIRKAIGAFAAVLGGLDTLVFSGGIGEHAAAVRARVCSGLGFLGLALDDGANERSAGVLSGPRSHVMVRMIPTNEELTIARAAWHVLAAKAD